MHFFTSLSEPLIYAIAFGIIFAETGIVACFFLPGDTLLLSLGLFAHQGIISLPVILLVLIAAGFFGNLLGYQIGHLIRDKRDSSKLLRRIPKKYIDRTESFYKKYGTLTVVLSRFVPIVRTVAPFLAGVSQMNYRRYVSLSFLGAIAWAGVVTGIGFLFGSYVSMAAIGYISIGLMIAASVLTPLIAYISSRYIKKG